MELLTVLIMLGMSLLLAQGSYNHFLRAFQNGDTSFDIDLIVWPTKLVVVAMFVVVILRLLLQVWGYSRALYTGAENPVAVPLVEDAATVAAREAASEIGIWVTSIMMVFVVMGLRVAYAAAAAGFIGLFWIKAASKGADRGFDIAMNIVGITPHSKVSILALSLIPIFIMIGFLA